MRLIRSETFAARYFAEGDAPCKRTIKTWVENGTVAGRIVGMLVYVDADAWERSTGNAVADRILQAAA